MLKIRLQKIGKRNSPTFRVVLVEHTSPPKGKFQEILGFYNPKTKEKDFKKERIEYWLSQGVQVSATINNLLVDAKIVKDKKVKSWRPKIKPAADQPVVDKQAGPPNSESVGGEAPKPIDTEPKTA